MIDHATIDRIYAAADIVDIVGDYVTLKRKGANYQACCPFHNEKNTFVRGFTLEGYVQVLWLR